MPVTRKDLDNAKCKAPGCDCTAGEGDEMLFQPMCHNNAGCRVGYIGGVLYLRCVECDRPVASIAVAEQSPVAN